MIGKILVNILNSALTLLTMVGGSGDALLSDLGEYTPPAEITYIETSTEQQGSMLLFGNLIMELPEGVKVEIKDDVSTDAGDMQTIVLDGAQELVGDGDKYNSTGPFPPQIRLAHYTAEYECDEALISALLDMFPGINLRVQYNDDIDNKYVFRLGSGYYGYEYLYILVCEDDLYIVGEFDIESGYSFSALREQGKVKWQDDGETVGENQNLKLSYFKFTPDENKTFLCRDCGSNLFFYLDGYFSHFFTSGETGKSGYVDISDLTDVNFDGYTDVSLSSRRALVWNAEKDDFVTVEYPEDMPFVYGRESYPETKTIWCYDNDYLSYIWDSNNRDYIESLWQWENFELVKKRECKAEIRENGVKVRVYEENSNIPLFSESFTLEEWNDKSNENVRAMYERFYDGLVPMEFSPRGAKDNDEKIPQGLLDKITDAMMNGTEFETLKAMMKSVKLTDEEVYAIAQESEDIRVYVLEGYQDGSYILAAADVDNDGIEDIIGEFYWGGTGGFVDYLLFKGQEDGTYVGTSSFGSVKEEFGVIAYEGKNYLVRTLYDYGKKFYNGFCVTVYEDGQYTEEAYLYLYAKDYDTAIERCDEGYEACAKEVIGNVAYYDELVEDYKCVVGSTEELAEDNDEYKYVCDLDNDGELEYYNKSIWTCSNTYTVDGLSFSEEDDEGSNLIHNAIQERHLSNEYYNAIMLWADDADGETIINVMYQTSLEDLVVVGYVVSGSEYREVYEITAAAVMGVEQSREEYYDR